MKKSLVLIIIFSFLSCCYAQEHADTNVSSEPNEIFLNSTPKSYNLKKPDYQNERKTEQEDEDDDNDLPLNMMTSPLQILKQQYQQGNFRE